MLQNVLIFVKTVTDLIYLVIIALYQEFDLYLASRSNLGGRESLQCLRTVGVGRRKRRLNRLQNEILNQQLHNCRSSPCKIHNGNLISRVTTWSDTNYISSTIHLKGRLVRPANQIPRE